MSPLLSPTPLTPSHPSPITFSLNTPGPSQPSSPPLERNRFNNDLPWLRSFVSDKAYNYITQNLGLVCIAIAQLFFASMNLTVKYFLSITEISVPTLVAVRMGITAVCCVIALNVIGDPNPFLGPPEMRKMLALRGSAGFIGLVSNYQSFKGLSVSDSTSIQFLSPSLAALLGFLVMGERPSSRDMIAGLGCLSGVILVSRPPFIFGGKDEAQITPSPDVDHPNHSSRMVGVTWALVAVCGGAVAYTIIRRMGNQAHPLHTIAYFAYFCTIATVILAIVTPGPIVWVDTWGKVFLILQIGVFGFIAQMMLTLGLQRERMARAGIAMYLSVFFSIILELVFLHTFPSFLSLIGITIILSSAYWVAQASIGPKREVDIESGSVSRSPSPAALNARTLRGDYFSVPTKEGDQLPLQPMNDGARHNGDQNGSVVEGDARLKVHQSVQRRASNTSTRSGTSGVTSGYLSE